MQMKQDEESFSRAVNEKIIKEIRRNKRKRERERKKILNMNCFKTFVD